MAPRKKTPPPLETAEPGIPPAPAWLRKSCRAAYTNHCRRLRDDGCTLHHVDANHVARLVHSEEDLAAAEAAAADAPLIVPSKANGEVLNPVHKRCSELRSEVRAWLRQLPRVPATRTSTPATSAATSSTPTAATQEPRLELIARIKARLAAMQSTGADGNPTGTTTPAAS